MEGRGISGFIICLIPAVFANHEVQSPLCSCRQRMVASVCRWHVPAGALQHARRSGARQRVWDGRSSSLYSWSCHTLPLPLTHTHTHHTHTPSITLPTWPYQEWLPLLRRNAVLSVLRRRAVGKCHTNLCACVCVLVSVYESVYLQWRCVRNRCNVNTHGKHAVIYMYSLSIHVILSCPI